MTLNLRPFASADYPAFAALHNKIHTDAPESVRELKHFFATFQDDLLVWDVLEAPDQTGLTAACFARKDQMGEGQVRFDLYLEPAKWETTLKEKLYAALIERVAEYGPTALTTNIREDWRAWTRFYEGKGFVETERQWESRLDLTTFEATPFAWATQKAAAAGVTFKTWADLPSTEETQHLLYTTIAQELLPDVPFSEPLNIWPFETWLERVWHNPYRAANGTFLAFAGDELVGISELFTTDDRAKFTTGLTAVKRAYRRQGIAQSLKLKAAEYARMAGGESLLTTNHSVNRPMLAINEAIGFEKFPAWLRLKKGGDKL